MKTVKFVSILAALLSVDAASAISLPAPQANDDDQNGAIRAGALRRLGLLESPTRGFTMAAQPETFATCD